MLTRRLSRLAGLAVLAMALFDVSAVLASETGRGDIDRQIWDVIAATVVAGDVEGMAATYHPDAVLVSQNGTVAIADQLVKWGEGMERARLEGRSASVLFRFTSRQVDATTAFEQGMFRYAETDEAGVESPDFIPFEALLVKRGGRWLIVMERQLEASDEAAWNRLDP